ncbi:MAG: BREX-1 system adenine-specific DNA-methyltransferase PglX, partial [Polyangiaceae bacterium]|nr:BREX-1 system adenine-specific DNA-methyltransferase PglX [Polyangiaceae bacterium]
MSLNLRDCTFVGPAMLEPFVKLQLEDLLAKNKLLPKASGPEAKALQDRWEVFRRTLRRLGETGGEARVRSHVLEPLVELLGWSHCERAENEVTREGAEDGGHLLRMPLASGGGLATQLRAWVVPTDTDLDAPSRRGRAYRYSPSLVAQRVLLARGERVALITDGLELRILLSDPSGRDSHISIRLDSSGGWRGARDVPDSFRLVKALCQPAGVAIVGDLLSEARVSQSSVTKKLREQARRAVEQFLQGILDDPANLEARRSWTDLNATSKLLWREGLVLVYRLLFILKLESSADPARAFSFASTSLWRNSYSPSTALAPVVAQVRDKGAETGEFLAASLRALFRLFSRGMQSSDLRVGALGGGLFGKEAMPILGALHWSEQAAALLLDALLWTPPARRCGHDVGGRERVHYGSLDVEDLGRVYEALLELEPGITSEPMCRLRRARLEVVVPIAQGAPYRKNVASEDEASENEQDEQESSSGKGKTKVAFIEEIPAGRFYLRVGLGRKASGSYYTPHAFVRYLVQETLGPQVEERSPQQDPNPLKILALNVLDPAMGSGHFLVEACRFLGDALYESCRQCDEQALRERELAESAKSEAQKRRHHARATELWQRVEDLPDPNDELVTYLPSRNRDAAERGLSQHKALSRCRRLVAVHCLYGVDKNPLAVELAKVALWLESFAQGLPLTFLDHRLICGDSLTGPFVEHLFTLPGSGKPVETKAQAGLRDRLQGALERALRHVRELESNVGEDIAEHESMRGAKAQLDSAVAPFRLLAAAWAGGVMLGPNCDDGAYLHLVVCTAGGCTEQVALVANTSLVRMVELGREAVPYDLVYPEVYHRDENRNQAPGFDAVLGNPPWESLRPRAKEFFAHRDLRILDAPTKRERAELESRLRSDTQVAEAWSRYEERFNAAGRSHGRLFEHQDAIVNGHRTGGDTDLATLFAE